jgi:rod shape-determining protein MreC
MESFLGRYRNLTILVGVLFLQVLGLAVQVKRSGDPENTRLIRIWAVDAVTPFERILVWVQQSSGNLWHNYVYLRGVRAENRELKQQIEQMRLEQVRLNEDAEQAHRLQKLLAFKEQVIAKTLPAQVIGTSGNDLSQSIYIDKGSDDGIKPDMAVITADGIVGKVLHVYPTTAQVLMINDQTSGVGAMLEKTRVQGVLKGTPNASVVLERVMNDEKVAPGDVVLSSGGDQIFPKGMPVGTVTKVSPGHEMFLNIQVKPAADLGRLEEVLVVTEKQEREVATENTGQVRAADILAQRLPSVPDKPADDAAAGSIKTVAKTPTGIAESVTEPQSAASASPKIEGAHATAGATSSATGGGLPATKATGSNATGRGVGPGNNAEAGSQDVTGQTANSGVKKTGGGVHPANPGLNSQSAKDAASKANAANSSNTLPKTTTSRPQAANPQSAIPQSPTPQPTAQPPVSQDDPH